MHQRPRRAETLVPEPGRELYRDVDANLPPPEVIAWLGRVSGAVTWGRGHGASEFDVS